MTQGSSVDRAVAQADIRERAKRFNDAHRGLPQYDRELALMKLVERVAKEQESLDVLQEVVRSGMWLLELQGVLARSRWVKELQRLLVQR